VPVDEDKDQELDVDVLDDDEVDEGDHAHESSRDDAPPPSPYHVRLHHHPRRGRTTCSRQLTSRIPSSRRCVLSGIEKEGWAPAAG
jgi:hypothetical protein